MIVGVPKEIKVAEERIALTPAGARAFSDEGHRVLVEASGGAASKSGADPSGARKRRTGSRRQSLARPHRGSGGGRGDGREASPPRRPPL